jgi:hypothetical protein
MGERLAFTFALTGRGNGDMVPRALPWARNLLGFQPAQGRRQGFFRTISTYLIFLDFEHPTFQGQRASLYQPWGFLYFEHHSFSRLMTDGASGARRIRRWDVMRLSLVPDAFVAGT